MKERTNFTVINPVNDESRKAFFEQCWSSAARLPAARGSKQYYSTGNSHMLVSIKGLDLLAPQYEWDKLLMVRTLGSVVVKDEETHRSLTLTALQFADCGVSGWCIMRGDYLEEEEDDQTEHFRITYQELNPTYGETRSEFLFRCWNNAERKPDAASVTGFYRATDYPVTITRIGYELLMGGSDNFEALHTTVAVASDISNDREVRLEYNPDDNKWHIERAAYCIQLCRDD